MYSSTTRSSRRFFLVSTAGICFSRSAKSHDLKTTDPAYNFTRYEAIVNNPNLMVRQVYEYPNINNAIIFANAVNGLNGFQFSYGIPANRIQVVVQAYSSANAVMYDDYIWEKYKFGEARNIKDPRTGEFATRNIYFNAVVPYTDLSSGVQPADRDHPFYSDSSIEGLQRRLALFNTWHQTVHGDARAASAIPSRNPDNKTADQIVDEIQAHLVSGANLIPAAVGELVRLQDKGFRLVVNG